MSGTETNADNPETTTLTLRVTETFLEDIDAAWKEEGYTSRSEFLRHAVRDAVDNPGISRSMLVDIAAAEYERRTGDAETYTREEILELMDDE
jgi:Arc/MetJ-type ribon-helix-helix transcriptional regulator